MFTWLSTLLHWRQGNDVIVKGSQIQFIPWKGVYVIARQYEGRTVLTILNGTSQPAQFDVKRYAEVIGSQQKAKDVITGASVSLLHDLALTPRQTLILSLGDK